MYKVGITVQVDQKETNNKKVGRRGGNIQSDGPKVDSLRNHSKIKTFEVRIHKFRKKSLVQAL